MTWPHAQICEREMELCEAPTAIFRLGSFELWRWRKDYACVECEIDRQHDHDRKIYDVGFDDGAHEALKHARYEGR